ncbi:O-glycosyl hydrolase [Pedobacter sp. UYP30]|uniref:glycoside hydrolase n=1 Tax=Pedobacter sp. UYP30 TaxID=1756400 RepID=UPI00339129D7
MVLKKLYSKFLLVCSFSWLVTLCACGQQKTSNTFSGLAPPINITINVNQSFQTIDNFGASDAWAFQFLGNWPEVKKQAIANLLFSTDTTSSGQPKGIGLSLWRYNFGAGSTQQGIKSGIKDEWRRAESFLDTNGNYNFDKQSGQTWFLNAAKDRGVNQFLGFFNSPPVQFTKNGKAFSSDGSSNIDKKNFPAFTHYMAESLKGIRQKTGILFDYISPVNEPQWDWKDGGQEGNPYTNTEIYALVKNLNDTLNSQKLSTKIAVTEAGQLDYLIGKKDKPSRGNQTDAFFNQKSPTFIGNLSNVKSVIDGHSYFTTSPYSNAVKIRKALHKKNSKNNIGYWMSEYCILGDNDGEIDGSGRDFGITPALYLARVIHNDLVNANASAWHWWTAVSAYDYKDGLIYINKNKNDGNYHESKMLWALGNFSKFIRPGYQRIGVSSSALSDDSKELLVSAYRNTKTKKIVAVVINLSAQPLAIKLNINGAKVNTIKPYVTSSTANLAPKPSVSTATTISIPPLSIVTLVGNNY